MGVNGSVCNSLGTASFVVLDEGRLFALSDCRDICAKVLNVARYVNTEYATEIDFDFRSAAMFDTQHTTSEEGHISLQG